LPAFTGLKPDVNGMALLIYAKFNRAKFVELFAKKGLAQNKPMPHYAKES
jgi:hypothetical protein